MFHLNDVILLYLRALLITKKGYYCHTALFRIIKRAFNVDSLLLNNFKLIVQFFYKGIYNFH